MLQKIIHHPKITVLVTLAITGFFAAQIPRAELDNNNFRFLPEDEPARLTVKKIDDTFKNTNYILIGIERRDGGVFTPDFLNILTAYVERIQNFDIVESVDSLVSADYIYGEDDAVIVEPLWDGGLFENAEQAEELKRRVLSWDFYRRALISDDLNATQVLVTLNISAEEAGRKEMSAVFLEIRDIARDMFTGTAETYAAGLPIVSAAINESVKRDLSFLLPLVIIVVLVVMYLPLKSVKAVCYVLLPVFVSVICAIGAMPLMNVKLSIISTVIPVVLVAVGNSYGLHIIMHYVDGIQSGIDVANFDTHIKYIYTIVKRTSIPVFLAALTTLVSFLAFCWTKVPPIREFGLFSAIGVLAAFLASVTFLPSVLLLTGGLTRAARTVNNLRNQEGGCPPRSSPAVFRYPPCRGSAPATPPLFPPKLLTGAPPVAGSAADMAEKAAAAHTAKAGAAQAARKAAAFVIRGKKRIPAAALVLGGVCVFFAAKIVVDNIFIDYFQKDAPIVAADRFLREQFGGTKIISVMVEADSADTMLHPDTLTALDGLSAYLEKESAFTGKSMSFTALIKRINQVLYAPSSGVSENYTQINDIPVSDIYADAALSDTSYYEIPSVPERYGKQDKDELRALIANELFFLADISAAYANDPFEPNALRSIFQLSTLGERDTNSVVDKINVYVQENFPPEVRITIGGPALAEIATNHLVVNSVWSSMLIAAVCLFIIVAVVNKSVFAGFLGLVPLTIAVLFNFAVMAIFGIKLNIGTAMISSLAMGIGIDYTIHFIESLKMTAKETPDRFLEASYKVSGAAIITDAVSTGLGFAVLLFSRFVMLAHFGALVSLALLTGAAAGLILVPALLALIKPKMIAGAKLDIYKDDIYN